MFVVFIHGPAASGKYTIGRRLSDLSGLPLFHNHLAVDAANALFDFGTPAFNALRASIWRCAFTEAAQAQRSFIFTFHPEASVAPSLIADLVALVESAGGTVHFIALHCAPAIVLERLGQASRKGLGKLTDPELYRTIDAQGGFDFPALPSPLVQIDTGLMGADAAAAKIAAALH